MNNFFDKALALRKRYYEDAVKSISEIKCLYPNYPAETVDPCEDNKIEMLSQLVATYVTYGENIPDNFSIKLSQCYFTNNLSEALQTIFNDLAITYKVETVSYAHSYNQYASAYTYNITLLK